MCPKCGGRLLAELAMGEMDISCINCGFLRVIGNGYNDNDRLGMIYHGLSFQRDYLGSTGRHPRRGLTLEELERLM